MTLLVVRDAKAATSGQGIRRQERDTPHKALEQSAVVSLVTFGRRAQTVAEGGARRGVDGLTAT